MIVLSRSKNAATRPVSVCRPVLALLCGFAVTISKDMRTSGGVGARMTGRRKGLSALSTRRNVQQLNLQIRIGGGVVLMMPGFDPGDVQPAPPGLNTDD